MSVLVVTSMLGNVPWTLIGLTTPWGGVPRAIPSYAAAPRTTARTNTSHFRLICCSFPDVTASLVSDRAPRVATPASLLAQKAYSREPEAHGSGRRASHPGRGHAQATAITAPRRQHDPRRRASRAQRRRWRHAWVATS